MRVIAGSFKGRRLVTPRGATTRPTADQVRIALMDTLGPWLPDARVLDLFAGAGVVGARPAELSRRLGLDKTLAWKVTRFVESADPVRAFRHMPGAGGVEIVLRAAGEAEASGDACEAVVDRHGARSRYGPLLRARFPDRPIRVEREGRRASSYLAGPEGAPLRVRFEEKADGASVATGLTSMAAKYLREALVASLNSFVLREAPGVRPTAGYWTDGLRFLRETAEARRRLGVDDGLFVRCR